HEAREYSITWGLQQPVDRQMRREPDARAFPDSGFRFGVMTQQLALVVLQPVQVSGGRHADLVRAYGDVRVEGSLDLLRKRWAFDHKTQFSIQGGRAGIEVERTHKKMLAIHRERLGVQAGARAAKAARSGARPVRVGIGGSHLIQYDARAGPLLAPFGVARVHAGHVGSGQGVGEDAYLDPFPGHSYKRFGAGFRGHKIRRNKVQAALGLAHDIGELMNQQILPINLALAFSGVVADHAGGGPFKLELALDQLADDWQTTQHLHV